MFGGFEFFRLKVPQSPLFTRIVLLLGPRKYEVDPSNAKWSAHFDGLLYIFLKLLYSKICSGHDAYIINPLLASNAYMRQ